MQPMKIKINSPEHSERVQKALFALGYNWNGFVEKFVQETNKECLWADSDNTITYSDWEYAISGYSRSKNPEYFLDTDGVFKPIAQMNAETSYAVRSRKTVDKERALELSQGIYYSLRNSENFPSEWVKELWQILETNKWEMANE